MAVKRIAVIFVHGLFSSGAVWRPFTDLIRQDPDLADFELLAFEYASPKLRLNPLRRIPNFNVLADNLQTFLEVEAAKFPQLILVSHSQGGLIIQRYLARMLIHSRGRNLKRIRRIVLFACPNSGSEIFLLARRSLPWWRHPQEQELRPINEAVTEAYRIVLDRVVHAGEVLPDRCPIPIVAYAGESDGVVTSTSARGVFPDFGVIPGDHSSIIRPHSLSHRSFTTLKSNLLAALADLPGHGGAPIRADRPDPVPAITMATQRPAAATQSSAISPPRHIGVGEGAGDMASAFKAAYAEAGDAVALGMPSDEAARLDLGYVQPFDGGPAGEPVYICALPDRAAAVVSSALWAALGRVGGGPERGAGVAAAGFPVRTLVRHADEAPYVVDDSTMSVYLAGGSWGQGRMVRASVDRPWVWQPVPRLGFDMWHNSRWPAGDGVDLRVRAVVDVAWLTTGVRPEVTRAHRQALQRDLTASEFANVIPVLSLHRGARLGAPAWAPATGPHSYHSANGVHLQAALPAPDGIVAVSGETILHVPEDATMLPVWACVELRVNFDAWRAALRTAGADVADSTDLRLSIAEVIEVLAAAWGTAAAVAARTVDDPMWTSLAKPPYVEMHVQTGAIVVTPTHQQLGLADAVDLTALGPGTRDGARSETGMRVVAPLDIDRAQRRTFIARGLAHLGRSWGHIDADPDDLLAE